MSSSQVWSTAQNLFGHLGWERVSEELETQISETDDLETSFGDQIFEINTHERNGPDFSSQVLSQKSEILKASKGRKIFFVNDESDEWHSVLFFFSN